MNYFDPAVQAVLSGFGNVGGYQNIPVNAGVEFGWNAGPNQTYGTAIVNIDETPGVGYQITWTESILGPVPPYTPSDVTLYSDSFVRCTGITLQTNPPTTFSSPKAKLGSGTIALSIAGFED